MFQESSWVRKLVEFFFEVRALERKRRYDAEIMDDLRSEIADDRDEIEDRLASLAEQVEALHQAAKLTAVENMRQGLENKWSDDDPRNGGL